MSSRRPSARGQSEAAHPPRWGQVFLTDPQICARIVAAAGPTAADAVIEVGPGRGALTGLLAASARRVVAIEIDAALADGIAASLPDVELVRADATEVDWGELATLALAGSGEQPPPVLFVANLPYESATPILLAWLQRASTDARLGTAVVMVQTEVGARLAAGPGGKTYGSLGVLAQATHDVRKVLDVAPGSFRPVPRVRSRVVKLTRRSQSLVPPGDWPLVARFVHRAFLHRRKQLAVALAGEAGLSRDAWADRLEAQGHPRQARVEDLPPHAILALRPAVS